MKVADDHLIMNISMGGDKPPLAAQSLQKIILISPIHPKYFIEKNRGEK